MTGKLQAWRDGSLGRLMLDWPEAFNALTHGMVTDLLEVLTDWRSDDGIDLILIEGRGEKAFCAGGDIQDLWHRGTCGDHEFGRLFWRDEYQLDAMTAHYPKPYVALMDGIVMGGGVGVSAHGSHRIVTERTLVAMPEVSIGFLPDVGGNWILSRAPGRLGEYLAMTATRLGPADAIRAGFADHFIPADAIGDLVPALAGNGIDSLGGFGREPPAGVLDAVLPEITLAFSTDDGPAILERLDASSAPWVREAAAAIRRHSPLSVSCALEAVRMARELPDLESCLAMEFRFAWRSIVKADFLEGIRAAIIDKDRRPRWQHASLEDVTPEEVSAMFASLGNDDLAV